MNLLYTPVLFGQGGADSALSFPASFSAAVLPATKPVRGDVKHFHQIHAIHDLYSTINSKIFAIMLSSLRNK
jgi:hypothetical protein